MADRKWTWNDAYHGWEIARTWCRRNAICRKDLLRFHVRSTRARNCLRNAGIRTIGDLLKKDANELLGISNFGPMTMRAIIFDLFGRVPVAAAGHHDEAHKQWIEAKRQHAVEVARLEARNVELVGVLAAAKDTADWGAFPDTYDMICQALSGDDGAVAEVVRAERRLSKVVTDIRIGTGNHWAPPHYMSIKATSGPAAEEFLHALADYKIALDALKESDK